MSRTLRAGLIGLGHMGRHHARVLREMPEVDLVAAVDTREGAGNNVWSLDVVDTVEELLARDIEMCVLATPTVTHEQIGLQLAEAGVATLIEKPLAHDAKAAQNIVEAFERTDTLGCVGHIERFNPALQEMRRRLAADELGSLYQVVTRRQGPFPDRILDAGVILDLATHDVDLTAWVTDSAYRVGLGPVGAPQRPPARGPREHRRGAVQRVGRDPPRELAVAVQGARHDRHRRPGVPGGRHAHRGPHALQERFAAVGVGPCRGVPRGRRGRRHPLRDPQAGTAHHRAAQLRRGRAGRSRQFWS